MSIQSIDLNRISALRDHVSQASGADKPDADALIGEFYDLSTYLNDNGYHGPTEEISRQLADASRKLSAGDAAGGQQILRGVNDKVQAVFDGVTRLQKAVPQPPAGAPGRNFSESPDLISAQRPDVPLRDPKDDPLAASENHLQIPAGTDAETAQNLRLQNAAVLIGNAALPAKMNPYDSRGPVPFISGDGKGKGPDANGDVSYDCSGLVTTALRDSGVKVDPTAVNAESLFTQGSVVSVPIKDGKADPANPGDLKPGDLLFFRGSHGTDTQPGHVAMYVGGGKMVEGAGSSMGIVENPISKWGNFMGAKRPPAEIHP